MSNYSPQQKKRKFLIRNLAKGLLYFIVLITLYFVVTKYLDLSFHSVLGPIDDNYFVVYVIFMLSEVLFGIIPPELFMLWAKTHSTLLEYVGHTTLLAMISYIAGIIGFFVGRTFRHTRYYQKIRERYLINIEKKVKQFGAFFIIVAALTPLPFSATAMVVGALHYPFKKYLLYSLIRFGRFILYAFLIWEANEWI